MRNKIWPRAFVVVVAILAASVIAACGSSKTSTPSSAGATSSAAAPAATSSALTGALAKVEQPPNTIAISAPLPRKPPTGKHIAFLDCSQPTCPPFATGLDAAAKALGWTVTNIGFQPTPEAEVQALDTALAQKPSGIFVTGLPRSVISVPLAKAAAEHIPVVDGYDTNPVVAPFIANIDNLASGKFAPTAVADWVANDTGCKGDVANFSISTYPILVGATNVFESRLKRLCPGIVIKSYNAQATDVGTKIPGYVVTALQSDPKIKVAAFAFGSMTLGVPAALKSAGLSAQLVGYGADTPTNVQSVADGQESAETGYGLPYGGWRAMDAFARYFEGASAAVDTSAPNPGRLYVKSNSTGSVTFNTVGEEPLPKIASQFESLWHLG
jgi:ABC-type sugar transport system substrate-binding protein